MTEFKTFLPFDSSPPNNFNFKNISQGKYIFSEELYISSGSIVIITIKEKGKVITLIIYFDNLAAQITSVTLFNGAISMPIFREFIEKAKLANLFRPVNNYGEHPSWLKFRKFVLILVPKVFNRDWIYRKLSEQYIILKSYLWKEPSIPRVLVHLNKFFNNDFRSNPSPESLANAIKKFNLQVKNKLKELEDDSIESKDHEIIHNSSDNTTKGHINNNNKPLFNRTWKRGFSTLNRNHSNKPQSNDTDNIMYPNLEIYKKRSRKSVAIEDVNIVSEGNIINLVNKFKDEIQSILNDNLINIAKISTQFKILFEDGSFRSCSAVDVINFKDIKYLEKSYIYNWNQKYSQHYHSLPIKKIIISYRILPEHYKRKLVSYISEDNYRKSFTPLKVNKQIPRTMDIHEWGSTIIENALGFLKVKLKNSQTVAYVTQITPFKNIVAAYYKGIGEPIMFTDERESGDLTTFTRSFENITYKFAKGVEVLYKESIEKISFIEKVNEHLYPKDKVITMDLETREVKGKLVPLCISIFIPKSQESKSTRTKDVLKTFTVWDYKTPEAMIIAAFRMLMVRKYHGYNIYFHNFSHFDSIFIIKILANIPDTQIALNYREGKLLKLTIKFDGCRRETLKSSNKNLRFRGSLHIFDSLLILPSSLDKLGKAFNAEDNSNVKTIFPLKFLNDESTSLDYDGEVPDLKFFHHPNSLNKKAYIEYREKYKLYKKSFNSTGWNLKKELVKYCEQDVKVLHTVISKFANEIYNKFKVNILKYPTLPSIAFAIYRLKFMPANTIPIIKGRIYNDIKNAYYGGFVDVYKPYGENVKSYDVNSLYPTSMEKRAMPVGKPTYLEGDSLSLSDIFGFVYVKVHAPEINTPILPYKSNKSPNSTRYPTGTWEGWYFTEELLNAMKYGYKFNIIKGYHFNKAIIFSDYVNTLYAIKQKVSPANPWYIISKLLLNSLYGRFGMNPELIKSIVMKSSMVDEFNCDEDVVIIDEMDLDDKTWIQYTTKTSDEDEESLNNISVPISAAIAAWSRIHMTEYIMKYSNEICYIDTDGIKVECEISSKYVGNKLGDMKFEGDFNQAVFIAPKVYGGVNLNDMITKIKGLKDVISYWLLKNLLYIPEVKISQAKWKRDISNATINIINQVYTLSATENKRQLIRDSLGRIVSTRPYKMYNGEVVEQEGFILYYLPKWLELLGLPAPYLNLKSLLPSPFIKLLLAAPIPDIHLTISLPQDCWCDESSVSINLTGCLSILYIAERSTPTVDPFVQIWSTVPYIIYLPEPELPILPKVIELPAPKYLLPIIKPS